MHPGRSAYNHLLFLAADPGPAPVAGGPGARPGRAAGGGPQADRRVLPRHGAAGRHRRGHAGRPAGAAAGRAGQWARPGGHPVDQEPDQTARHRGPHHFRVQPPDERDGRHGGPSDRDRPGQAHRRLQHPGIHRAQFRQICPGPLTGRSPAGRPDRRRGRQGRAGEPDREQAPEPPAGTLTAPHAGRSGSPAWTRRGSARSPPPTGSCCTSSPRGWPRWRRPTWN